MDTLASKSYQRIVISGPITVERTDVLESDLRRVILILGPTGAGKSTLIEAFANNSTLRISSNRLDGFTQSISAYRLHNVSRRSGEVLYLVDVPGFADSRISVMGIVSLLKDWMNTHAVRYFTQLIYVTPVNVVRLPGSQREVLRTFQALTGIKTADMTTIVSTMWDSIWSESARSRAESNFKQLQEEIWKEHLSRGSRIVKFMNTQESALSVLDAILGDSSATFLNVEDFCRDLKTIHQTPFASHLYEDLQTRVAGLKLQKYNIQSEVREASVSADKQLITILRLQLEEVDKLLAKFEAEMIMNGLVTPPPPIPSNSLPPQSGQVPIPTASSIMTPTTSSIHLPTHAGTSTNRGLFTQVLEAMKCWRKTN